MKQPQYLALSAAFVLFALLYFGFPTKTSTPKAAGPSQSNSSELASFESLRATAITALNTTQSSQLSDLEKQISDLGEGNSEKRIELLKRLSAMWYEFGNIPVAGGVAEQIAEIEHTDAAWSIAGGTFFNGLSASQDPTIRDYCSSHAVKAFESAASLAPDKVEHRVNLALVYAENPPPDNPMKAVLMLRELESKHPESPAVYNALGRLAIKTAQWQRAIDRLEKSRSLDPNNPNTPCLLAKAYEGAGDIQKAEAFAKICGTGK